MLADLLIGMIGVVFGGALKWWVTLDGVPRTRAEREAARRAAGRGGDET